MNNPHTVNPSTIKAIYCVESSIIGSVRRIIRAVDVERHTHLPGDPVTPVTASKGVHVYLTPEEAKALFNVCARVGGDPKGVRGYLDSIQAKLRKRGVSWSSRADGYTPENNRFVPEGSIHFGPAR